MPSLSTYHLTWVSLTLDLGSLFTAALAKCSRCSLPWMWGSSSRPLPLTLDVSIFMPKIIMIIILWFCLSSLMQCKDTFPELLSSLMIVKKKDKSFEILRHSQMFNFLSLSLLKPELNISSSDLDYFP